MDVRRYAEHGRSPSVTDTEYFGPPKEEEPLAQNRRQEHNASKQVVDFSVVGSPLVRSSSFKVAEPDAVFLPDEAEVSDDEHILNCFEQLCQTITPLGKAIDYVQSDLTSIAKERVSTTEKIRQQQIQLQAEKKHWEHILHLKAQELEKANRQLQQEKDEIATLEIQVFRAQARIQRILRSVTHSEEVERLPVLQDTGLLSS